MSESEKLPGDLILAARERSGLSQEEFAKRNGLSKDDFTMLENGLRCPTNSMLTRLLGKVPSLAPVSGSDQR